MKREDTCYVQLLHTFNPDDPSTEAIEYGRDQRVGRGGMAAKVLVHALIH